MIQKSKTIKKKFVYIAGAKVFNGHQGRQALLKFVADQEAGNVATKSGYRRLVYFVLKELIQSTEDQCIKVLLTKAVADLQAKNDREGTTTSIIHPTLAPPQPHSGLGNKGPRRVYDIVNVLRGIGVVKPILSGKMVMMEDIWFDAPPVPLPLEPNATAKPFPSVIPSQLTPKVKLPASSLPSRTRSSEAQVAHRRKSRYSKTRAKGFRKTCTNSSDTSSSTSSSTSIAVSSSVSSSMARLPSPPRTPVKQTQAHGQLESGCYMPPPAPKKARRGRTPVAIGCATTASSSNSSSVKGFSPLGADVSMATARGGSKLSDFNPFGLTIGQGSSLPPNDVGVPAAQSHVGISISNR